MNNETNLPGQRQHLLSQGPGVGKAMCDYIENEGVNVSRGGYGAAYSVEERVLDTRERLCALFGFDKPENVVFTSGVTASLNAVLKGFLRPGDHVLCSSMEHNAVMRPLVQLEKQGVAFTRVPCSPAGELDPAELERLIRPETKLVVMTHASNVCGTLMPVQAVGDICRRHGLFFVLDAAQTAGAVPIHMEDMHIDALCFTGHKGLLGPQGTGGFLIRDELAAQTAALTSGGTGSLSHTEEVPDFLPDKYEPGTPNLPGILGLRAALQFLEGQGVAAIGEHELDMAMRLIEGLRDIPRVRLAGRTARSDRTAVVSVVFEGMDNAGAAWLLESEYGILTRCGLHCAPSAHQTLGTFPGGTVRFVPGRTTTAEEIDQALAAIRDIAGRSGED